MAKGKQNYWKLSLSFVMAAFSAIASANELNPSFGPGQSDFQTAQAQEAIRSICGCVVGSGTMNPNCGALTAASLQTPAMMQPGYNMNLMGAGGSIPPAGSPALGGHGQQPLQPVPSMNPQQMPNFMQMPQR